MKIPGTFFSTPLSGSARETEARIRNIFQGQKKRPALLVMALTAVLILLCGSLVAFRPAQEAPLLVMDTQYYDSFENYIEIPALATPLTSQPSPAVEEINQALIGLKSEYRAILSGEYPEGMDRYGNQCLLYPSTTGRYLNLVFFRNEFHTDLNTGHVFTLVYDRTGDRLVSMEEALALAGTTREDLFAQLSRQIDPQLAAELAQAGYNWDVRVQNPALEGFRIRENGEVVFYLTAREDDADDAKADHVSGADHIYIWQDGTFTRCDQYSPQGLSSLVPAEELDRMSPPLWCQWYFEGGQPEGGFLLPSLKGEEDLDDPASPGLSAGASAEMREAYAKVLENLLQNNIDPSGQPTRLDLAYGAEENQFALYDVDGDGAEELVLLYATDIYAGYSGYVLAYDEMTGDTKVQLLEFPLLTFYDNGAVMAGWSHNQGWGGRFWPYNLYQYQPGSDSYIQVGMVDAWDREISDQNEGFPPFPTEIDVSGSGFVYYIMENGTYDNSNPVDQAVYLEWLNTYIGGASQLSLPYQPLTEETIQRLRTGE